MFERKENKSKKEVPCFDFLQGYESGFQKGFDAGYNEGVEDVLEMLEEFIRLIRNS